MAAPEDFRQIKSFKSDACYTGNNNLTLIACYHTDDCSRVVDGSSPVGGGGPFFFHATVCPRPSNQLELIYRWQAAKTLFPLKCVHIKCVTTSDYSQTQGFG